MIEKTELKKDESQGRSLIGLLSWSIKGVLNVLFNNNRFVHVDYHMNITFMQFIF